MKKLILMFVAVFLIAAFSGCIDIDIEDPEVPSTPTPIHTPTPTPSPSPSPSPTPTPDKERELITQYIMMHEPFTHCTEWENGFCAPVETFDTEVVIDHLMDYLAQYNLQPVEIYRQSLILYEPSYGYLYPSSYEQFFTREHDYNKEYDYPPLCFEDEQKYHLEWIVIGSIRINGMSGWSVSGGNYASEDINNIRAFIKVTMG